MYSYTMRSCLHCENTMCNTVFDPLSLVVSRDYTSLWVIIRRLHQYCYLATRKYVISRRGSWSYPYLGPVSRALKSYIVHDIVSSAPTKYEPLYGTRVPVLSCSDISIYFDPARFNDVALQGYEYMGLYDLPPAALDLLGSHCMYFTGSVLGLGYKEFSDLDIVLDLDSRCLSKIDQFISELTLYSNQDKDYILREALNRALNSSDVAALIPPWQHVVTRKNRRISVTLVNRQARRAVERRVFRVKRATKRILLHVEPYQQSIGDYPGIVETLDGPPLVVFDGFYVPALFLGGHFMVRGLELEVIYSGGEVVKALGIGLREDYTWIKKAKDLVR